MMDARTDMLERLRSRREGFTLPQPFYIDPDYFRLDMEMIWYRDWLFVGHDCELDKPGAFMTVQIGDYPAVIYEDKPAGVATRLVDPAGVKAAVER